MGRPVIGRAPLPSRERLQFGWAIAGLGAVAAVLVWTLWVIPVNRSIADAAPAGFGVPVTVHLEAGDTVGIWAKGASPALGTAECSATGPAGRVPAKAQHGALDWDDTLWWATARPGFSQIRAFSATAPGAYTVNCSDSLGSYGGEYLLADSADKGFLIGLERTGGADYHASSMLAFAAVGAPLLVLLLVPVMAIQTLRVRRTEAKTAQAKGQPGTQPTSG